MGLGYDDDTVGLRVAVGQYGVCLWNLEWCE